MIVVDLVKSQEKMQLLYHRGEYIVAIKMCLEDFCCGLLLSNSEPGMTLKKKQRNWGLFLNSPAMKIRLLKKVVSSLQYLSGAPHDDFLLNSLKTLFQAIQSTFRYLEMHSKRHYKICICSVNLGEIESFRNFEGFCIIFPKCLMHFHVLRK